MASQQAIDEVIARINTLEQYNQTNVLPDPRGTEFGMRNLAQVLFAMEAYVVTLKNDPPVNSLRLMT